MTSADYRTQLVPVHTTGGTCTVTQGGGSPAAMRETGAATEESPGGGPGDSSRYAVISASSPRLQVVAARPRVREEIREGAAANHVSARLGALTVADGDHAVEINGHFHAAAVVLTLAGLPPDRARQVDHGLLHS